jgi:hypothetical protein
VVAKALFRLKAKVYTLPCGNEIKHRQLEKQPIKGPVDFEHRLYEALLKLQEFKERVQSFFRLPETQYAGSQMSPA